MASPEIITEFVSWLLDLHLPRAPRFDSNEKMLAYLREWQRAFKTTPAPLFEALKPKLRDILKEWPTIPVIKLEIASHLGKNPLSSFGLDQPSIEWQSHFKEQRIFPGYAVLTKEQAARIEAASPGFTKNLLRLNKKTGEITDPITGRKEGNILDQKLK